MGRTAELARGVRVGLPAIGAPALALGLLLAGIVAFEDRFIYYPTRPVVGTPAHWGLPYQDVVFTTADGLRLHGWFIPGPRDLTWLFLHGNAGNIGHRLENLALIHQRLGVSVFIFDYRGYGQSEGHPSEQGTYRDAAAALAYVRSLPEVDPERVVLFGRSLGAAVAVELATHEPVRGLILETPFASVRAMAGTVLPFVPWGLLLRTRYDTLAKVERLSAPLLVLHSPSDEIVPYAQGQAVFAAAAEPKRFHAIVGASHNDTYLRGGEAYWQALADFLTELEVRPASSAERRTGR